MGAVELAKVQPKPGAVVSIAPIVTHIVKNGSIVPGTSEAETLRKMLTRRGASAAGAQTIVSMMKTWDVTPLTQVSEARKRVLEHNIMTRAAYMVNASRRVSQRIQELRSQGVPDHLAVARAAKAERPYYRLHVDAQNARERMAYKAEQEALRSKTHPVPGTTPGEVGWYATLDAKTTPECKAAHGTNFTVDDPPSIGVPGALHAGRCRCSPGMPWPYGKKTETALGVLANTGPPLTKATKLSNPVS